MKGARLLLLVVVFSVKVSAEETIITESTTNSTVTTQGTMETTVNSPPPGDRDWETT